MSSHGPHHRVRQGPSGRRQREARHRSVHVHRGGDERHVALVHVVVHGHRGHGPQLGLEAGEGLVQGLQAFRDGQAALLLLAFRGELAIAGLDAFLLHRQGPVDLRKRTDWLE